MWTDEKNYKVLVERKGYDTNGTASRSCFIVISGTTKGVWSTMVVAESFGDIVVNLTALEFFLS